MTNAKSLVIYPSQKIIVSLFFTNRVMWHFITFVFHYVYDWFCGASLYHRFQGTCLPDHNEKSEWPAKFIEGANTIVKMYLTKTMLELLKIKPYNIEIHERNEK